MAGNQKNIIVGAAQLFLSIDNAGAADVTVQRQDLPALVAGTPAGTTLGQSANWRDVGFTTDGLEMAYEPDYGSVAVDQLKDAALLFASALTVSCNTNLAEATLLNLMTAFGQDVTSLTSSGTPETQGGGTSAGTTFTPTGGTDFINIAGGSLGAYPVEHSLTAVGNGPRTPGGKRRERVYYARRVINVSASTHALRRTDATVFPVSFRLLPDPTYSGSEYGRVIDRTL